MVMSALAVDVKPDTRAVLRQIEPRNIGECPHCGEDVKFNARTASAERRQVIANVYRGRGANRRWHHVEVWHFMPCYVTAGMPYGIPQGMKDEDVRRMREAL